MSLLGSIKSKVTSTYQDAKTAVVETAQDVKGAASEAATKVADTAGAAVDTVKETASSAVSTVKATASSAAAAVQETASSAATTVKAAAVTVETKAAAAAKHTYSTGANLARSAINAKLPTGVTNAFGAAAQPAVPTTQSQAQRNSAEINDKLSRGVTDWAVTDSDVKDVHKKLELLPDDQYRAQLGELKANGKLDTYISNMTPEARSAFLDQANRKGFIHGGQVKVPDGPLNPPKGPTLYDNKTDLPPEMREAISENNLGEAKQYDTRYSEYMDRYQGALREVKTPEEMRNLGHWAPKHPLGTEPGYENNTSDPLANKWADERITKTRGDKETRELASSKMFQMTGRQPAGDVFVEVEVGAKVQYTAKTGTTVGVGGKVEAQVGSESGGDIKASGTPHAGQSIGKNVKVAVNDKEAELEVKGHSVTKEGNKVEVKVKTLGGEREVGPVKVGAGAGPYGSLNPDEARSASGAHGKGEIEVDTGRGKVGAEVNGKAGVGIRGITADEAYESIRPGPGYWTDPSELQQGTPWSSLPAETRDRYTSHYGWSEGEWEKKRPKYTQPQ